eukprot:gene32307-39071_t
MFGSFTNFSKALESIGQLVAPVSEEAEPQGPEDGGDDDHSFDNAIIQFIQKKRGQDDVALNENERQQTEPGSPNSLVEIALDDDSVRSRRRSLSSTTSDDSSLGPPPMLSSLILEHNNGNSSSVFPASKPVSNERSLAASASYSSPSIFLANSELEKKVQTKYRESLEDELFNTQRKVQQLEEECDYWKEKAQASPLPSAATCAKCSFVQTELSAARQELERYSLASKEVQEKCVALKINYQQVVMEKEELQREVSKLKAEVQMATNQHVSSIEKHEHELKAYKEKLATQETQVNMQRGLFLESERTNDLLRAEIHNLQKELRSHVEKQQGSVPESTASKKIDGGGDVHRSEAEKLVNEVSTLKQALEATERKLKAVPKSRLFISDEEFSSLNIAVQSICKLLEMSGTSPQPAVSSPAPQPPPTPTASTPYFPPAADVYTPRSDEGGAEATMTLTTSTLLYVLTLAQDKLACPPTPLPIPSTMPAAQILAHEEQVKKLEQEKSKLTNQVQEHGTVVDELKRHIVKCENENRQLHE